MSATKISKTPTKKTVRKTKPPKAKKQPKYSHHVPTDTARVWLWGKLHSLGKFNSPESWEKYHQLLADDKKYGGSPPPMATNIEITVNELVVRYLDWAEVRYKKVPQTIRHCRKAMGLLRQYYGKELVNNISPLSIEFLQNKLLEARYTHARYAQQGMEKRYARKYINYMIDIIIHAFKKGMKWQVVSTLTHHALQHGVEKLKQGETDAPEYRDIEPVPDEIVEKTLPFMSNTIAAMVRVQRACGMRCQDIRNLRVCDIDRVSRFESDGVWLFVPPDHKTKNRGDVLIKIIGFESQKILVPFIAAKENTPEAYLFCPADVMKLFFLERSKNRKTKVPPSQLKRRPKRNPQKAPGAQYSSYSYARAISDACDKAIRAGVIAETDKWHPNRLRHSAASEVYVKYNYNIAVVQAHLGHKSPETTKNYLGSIAKLEGHLQNAIRVAKDKG